MRCSGGSSEKLDGIVIGSVAQILTWFFDYLMKAVERGA